MSAQLPENLSKTAVDGSAQASPPATLGDVLYAGRSKAVPSETEWFALVRSVAAGDETALHALYERAHRLVGRQEERALAHVSKDGDKFTAVRQGYFPADVKVQVGLMCAAPEGAGFEAVFDQLTIEKI